MFKVMIVDDVEFWRNEVRGLEIWGDLSGFVISEEACNGDEALRKLEAASVDLIITDIRMPKIDGLELLQKVHSNKLAACVVLMSEFCEFRYAKQGIVHGAFDYIGKPVDHEAFMSLLERAKLFIEEKRREEGRLKRLETELEEKFEVFYPESDFQQIAWQIAEADIKAVERMSEVFRKLELIFENDSNKIELIIKKGMSEIYSTIGHHYPWFEKYHNLVELKDMDFSGKQDIKDLKDQVISSIMRLVSALKKFIFCNNGNFLVRRACVFILEHIDEKISVKCLAEKLFVSKTHLSETFKQKTGLALIEYITQMKIERAQKLIIDNQLMIYQIIDMLGYEDINYFNKIFKKYTGLSPTQFKKMISVTENDINRIIS